MCRYLTLGRRFLRVSCVPKNKNKNPSNKARQGKARQASACLRFFFWFHVFDLCGKPVLHCPPVLPDTHPHTHTYSVPPSKWGGGRWGGRFSQLITRSIGINPRLQYNPRRSPSRRRRRRRHAGYYNNFSSPSQRTRPNANRQPLTPIPRCLPSLGKGGERGEGRGGGVGSLRPLASHALARSCPLHKGALDLSRGVHELYFHVSLDAVIDLK